MKFMKGILVAAIALRGDLTSLVTAQLREVSSSKSSGVSQLVAAGRAAGIHDIIGTNTNYARASPGKTGDHDDLKTMGVMKGHGHAKSDGPEEMTHVKAEGHDERSHGGGKPQSHHDDMHASAREQAEQNIAKHGELHLNDDHAPLPPGVVDTSDMFVHPNTRTARDDRPLNKGPDNHTGFGHVKYHPPLYIDPHSEIHDVHLNNHGVRFEDFEERGDPKHEEHEEYKKEKAQKRYEHRQKLREYRERHGIKEKHPRRNKSKKHNEETLGYWGEKREKEGIPHPSEKYDFLHEEIQDLEQDYQDAVHLYGHHSLEALEIRLTKNKLNSIDKAADYLDWGMPQDEFDEMTEWLNEYHELEHEHGVLTKEHEAAQKLREDAQEKAEAGHLYSEEIHKIEDRKTELRELIRGAKQHHHMLYKPWDNEGSVKERVALRELYEKVHHTHDRAERLKLRNEYSERMDTIAQRRRYHSMDDDETELIQAIREQIHDTHDEAVKLELRNEVEEIYKSHRNKRREAGHLDDVHRPDLGHHRLEYNDMLHENDELLLSYHEQLRTAKSKEDQRQARLKIRDRVHELHHDGKKHPRHGVHA
jgi:hypothetical protein